MKKIHIIAHRHDQAIITSDLQNAGVIEIVTPGLSAGPPNTASQKSLFAARAGQLELEITRVQFVLNFLKKLQPVKTGLISSLIKERLVVNRSRFDSIEEKLDFEDLYFKCQGVDERLTAIGNERRGLEAEATELGHWEDLSVPLKQLRSSKWLGIAVGKVRRSLASALVEGLADACRESEVMFSSISGQTVYLVIGYFAPHKPVVERELSAHGFEYVDIWHWSKSPDDEWAEIQIQLAQVSEEERRLQQEAKNLLVYQDDLIILRDWLVGRRMGYDAQAVFAHTTSTFWLEGWVETKKVPKVTARLQAQAAVIDYNFSDPGPDDKPPTVLDNPGPVKPFEVLTRLYGVPDYNELDPTPFMAIFFFWFFGIALGDFGYGLVLIIVCWWLKKKLLLTEVGRLWLDLFALGGLASMIVGVPTGSYFGLETSVLPNFMQRLIILDPLKQAFIFLMFTWALGVAHVMTGLAIEFWDTWRHSDYADAVYSNLSQIAVVAAAVSATVGWLATAVFNSKAPAFTSLTTGGVRALGLTSLIYIITSGGFFSGYVGVIKRLFRSTAGEGANRAQDLAAVGVLLVLAGALIFPSGRGLLPVFIPVVLVAGLIYSAPVREALIALGAGLYNLYGMSALIGDILSYSRLMALGLATFLIGFVVNTLAGLVVGASVFGLPIGILLAALIAIPLHAVNLIINLLGAFVHPLRLQFVEFFSKFYDDGGRAFRPFSFETEHLIFREE